MLWFCDRTYARTNTKRRMVYFHRERERGNPEGHFSFLCTYLNAFPPFLDNAHRVDASFSVKNKSLFTFTQTRTKNCVCPTPINYRGWLSPQKSCRLISHFSATITILGKYVTRWRLTARHLLRSKTPTLRHWPTPFFPFFFFFYFRSYILNGIRENGIV